MGNHRNKNKEGYDDTTANFSVYRADKDIAYKRFKKTMKDLRDICEINGFALEGRVVLRDKTNGRVWR